MADLPVTLGPLEAVPPALRHRLRDVLARLPADGGALDGVVHDRLARLLDDAEPWIGADPGLIEVGLWLLDARRGVELRRSGCRWLAQFPSVAVVKRLAEVALDAATPPAVREQAIEALGDRQLHARHPATLWPVDAIQLADETLIKLADAATSAGVVTGTSLPIALRHVHVDGMAAVVARAPGLWGGAIECYATPPLARVLVVTLDEIPPLHRLRTLRLVGATLGEEAVPMLLARQKTAALDERLEMLLLAVSLGGEVHLGRLEDALRDLPLADLARQRAKWHLANRGVVPTVRGLKVARVTATLPLAERAAKCARAADDLAAITRFARHPEAYVYAMWGWAVRGSGDPAKTRELAVAHAESQLLVRDLYFEDLARRGRVKQLTLAAQTLDAVDVGALWLAIYGRPFAALELAATARQHTPELVCARALACYRAARPDLTERIVIEDLPPPEPVGDAALGEFPGAHERWMIEHAPAARPALGALAGGRRGVVAIAKPASDEAEADLDAFGAVASVVRRLGRGLSGATVYLAGELERRAAIVQAIEAAGARLVSGPFPDTDYYVCGDRSPAELIAQLERQGARRLLPGELEGR